jgi:hypothetical protein
MYIFMLICALLGTCKEEIHLPYKTWIFFGNTDTPNSCPSRGPLLLALESGGNMCQPLGSKTEDNEKVVVFFCFVFLSDYYFF